MATSSISTGCFVFKPNKIQPLQIKGSFKRAREAGLTNDAEEYDLYSDVWNTASQLISDFRSQIYSSVFEDMLLSLKKSSHEKDETTIPTAVLISGVNLPDHETVFHWLRGELQRHISPFVCLLTADVCTSVAVAVRNMVSQLTSIDDDDAADKPPLLPDDAEGDDGELVEPSGGPKARGSRSYSTMPSLVAFYTQYLESRHNTVSSPRKGSPRKRPRPAVAGPPPPPLVVMWKDLESFPPAVLQDLVQICSHYRRRLPLMFVFGVSTSVAVIHRLLPQHVSACLTLTTFSCQISSRCLQQFIDKVLLSESVPFRLGGRVLRLLLDIFLYNDFSINNFISGYKYCMLEHFLSSPAAALCRPLDSIPAAVAAMSDHQLHQLRRLGSVTQHVAGLPADRQRELQLNLEFRQTLHSKPQQTQQFRNWAVETLCASFGRCSQSVLALRCLFALASRLPGSLLGRQFRELYNTALLHDLCEREEFRRTLQLLGMMSKPELQLSLQAALHTVPLSATSLRARLSRHLASVDGLDDVSAGTPTVAPSIDQRSSVTGATVKHQLKTVGDRQALKQRLQSLGAAQVRQKNPYETLRDNILDDMQLYFRENISRPADWVLHEVFVFDDVTAVRRRLVGAPRFTLQTALADPARYLQCSCCQLMKDSGGVISSSMPDLCIVYKLHLECGSMINLFDWMQSFQAVLGVEQLDDSVQARFARAVAELQFLGFIRPTQKKTDHVARLTWGSC